MKACLAIDSSIIPKEALLVGVSGGVDSMVLLHTLTGRGTTHVAHFNHQLRGKASDEDERFVAVTAGKLGAPFHVERADIKSLARKEKISIEMAARKYRHEFFARLARKLNVRTIALAHHADDQVELFLLRLLRGAGAEGLAGMRETSASAADPNLTIIRPLLHATKEEILRYATENKIAFREDATNASVSILRNRIRHKLIPLLKRDYQPALPKTILRTIELLRADSDFIRQEGERRGEAFEKLPLALQRRNLRQQLYAARIEAGYDLIEFLRLNPNKRIHVGPQDILLRDASGTLQVLHAAKWSADNSVAHVSSPGAADFADLALSWSYGRGSSGKNVEYFDADKVGGIVTLRHWKAGDRFQPIGMKTAVKLQDLFTNAKIPRERRHRLVVAATVDGQIFWVEGLRISERFKIEPSTRRRLKWEWQRHETC